MLYLFFEQHKLNITGASVEIERREVLKTNGHSHIHIHTLLHNNNIEAKYH